MRELRPLEDPGARRARGARPRAGVVPGRGDRHAGRGPDPGAVHRRRQPGAVDARRRPARRGAGRARLHDQRRQLAQRDDPPRRRHPARACRRSSSRTTTTCIWIFAVGSAAQLLARRSSRPTDGRPEEWEILIRLAGACLGQDAADVDVAAIDDGFFDVLADDPRLRRRRRSGRGTTTAGPSGMLDLTLRTGPFGDRYGEEPDGLTLEQAEGRAARHRPRPDRAARSPRCSRPPTGRSHLAPPLHHRRPAPAGGAPRPARRRPRAGQPPPPALEQLVDAQRQGAREGQGPLHAAGAPRRRRRATASPTATLATVTLRGGHDRGAGRGHRRTSGPAWSRCPHGWGHDKAGHPARRSPTSTPGSTATSSPPAPSST